MARARSTRYLGPGCPVCGVTIDLALLLDGTNECPSCHGEFEAVRFDPPRKSSGVRELGAAGPSGATPCGNHAGNAAIATCARCGTFICGLCEIKTEDASLCPSCFERMSADGSLASLRTRWRDYGRLSGTVATLGCLFYIFSIILGPLAIHYAIKGLREKKAMGDREGLVGIWATLVFAGLETIAALFFFFFVFKGVGK